MGLYTKMMPFHYHLRRCFCPWPDRDRVCVYHYELTGWNDESEIQCFDGF